MLQFSCKLLQKSFYTLRIFTRIFLMLRLKTPLSCIYSCLIPLFLWVLTFFILTSISYKQKSKPEKHFKYLNHLKLIYKWKYKVFFFFSVNCFTLCVVKQLYLVWSLFSSFLLTSDIYITCFVTNKNQDAASFSFLLHLIYSTKKRKN